MTAPATVSLLPVPAAPSGSGPSAAAGRAVPGRPVTLGVTPGAAQFADLLDGLATALPSVGDDRPGAPAKPGPDAPTGGPADDKTAPGDAAVASGVLAATPLAVATVVVPFALVAAPAAAAPTAAPTAAVPTAAVPTTAPVIVPPVTVPAALPTAVQPAGPTSSGPAAAAPQQLAQLLGATTETAPRTARTGTGKAGPDALATTAAAPAAPTSADPATLAATAPVPPTSPPAVPAPATPPAAAITPYAAAPAAQPELAGALARLRRGADGVHEIEVALHPADLGSVQVRVTVSHGALDVTVACADPAARDAVTAALPALHRELAGLQHVDVTAAAGVRAELRTDTRSQTGSQQPGTDQRHGGPRPDADSQRHDRRQQTPDDDFERWM